MESRRLEESTEARTGARFAFYLSQQIGLINL
jgi:hypothetical protein